jgi:hypothetical protein
MNLTKSFLLIIGLIGFLGAHKSAAQCPNSGCTDYTAGLSKAERDALALQFAPQLRFDNGANTFPNDAAAIFAHSTGNTSCDPSATLEQTVPDNYDATSDWNSAKNRIPTYYSIQNDGDRYFIIYWWAYYRQPNCIGSTGGHDYDWEHLVVQARKVNGTYQKVSVTFFQHGGWYTKSFTPGHLEFIGDHPISYVGKLAHGNYHKGAACGFIQCCYYGDCRNASQQRYLNVWESNKLYELNCNLPWAQWPGNWGSTGKGPLHKMKQKFPNGYAYAPACKGDATTCGGGDGQQGCEYSNYGKTLALRELSTLKSASLTYELTESSTCVQVYPNPASDVIQISGISEGTLIHITDMQGRTVAQGLAGYPISVSHLPSAIYFLFANDELIAKLSKN